MSDRILVVFDTCTIPEYYDDVHRIIGFPRDFVVTYDYSAQNVHSEAQTLLDTLAKTPSPAYPVLLTYIQDPRYGKGAAQPPQGSMPTDALQVLTRLAHIVAVRPVKHDTATRYYFDLKLGGYPYDRNRSNAALVVEDLRKRNCIPMQTYVALMHDAAGETIFSQNVDDDRGFANVVENLGGTPSQFAEDTFWRVTHITQRSKSLVPLKTQPEQAVPIRSEIKSDKADVFMVSHDQTVLTFHLRFHRAREALTSSYRPRRIQLETSPKSFGESAPSIFPSRSFGFETVAVNIPSTSSLSQQEVSYRMETLSHELDPLKSFLYGPRLSFKVKYNKRVGRVLLSFAALAVSTALLAWAAFVSAPLPPAPADSCLIWERVGASVLGVLSLLYAYYLWSDEISLDKARR